MSIHSVSEFTQSGEVFGACAGAALYRRLVFLEIGYFDENIINKSFERQN